ncbi:MAG: stage 0 sporulation family protein [Bacilli bacterium]
MNDVYGISFKNDGKIYYFAKNDVETNIFDYVIVETEKGLQYGKVVVIKNSQELDFEAMKPVIRKATEEDFEMYLKNKSLAMEVTETCKKLASSLNLEMRVVDSSFTFDRKQLLINFYADDRVDFRELAKKLAGIYRTRIELRQIGARDKAREVSGLGVCGRELCCSKFLNHIDSITMNMAKNQNIALNPSKINGACGRLLCCLAYENDEYARCQNGMPFIGQTVNTKYGNGKVVFVDILNRIYKVDIDNDIKKIELGNLKDE